VAGAKQEAGEACASRAAAMASADGVRSNVITLHRSDQTPSAALLLLAASEATVHIGATRNKGS